MFEVGKTYKITMIEGGAESTRWGKIEKYEHPLIKTADHVTPKDHPYFPPGTIPGQIINVTSSSFVMAELDPSHDSEDDAVS